MMQGAAIVRPTNGRRSLRRLTASASALAIIAAGLAAAAPASAAPVTLNFQHTGSVQTWTVPSGVTSATFVLYGAEGDAAGESYQYLGGQGGTTTATLALTPGQVLELRVGGMGIGEGGYNGGGDAEDEDGEGWVASGGAGGGASDLRLCASPGSCALADRVLIAGGGGGASAQCGPGGSGGGTSGGDGCGQRPGLGGSQTEGGAGGIPGNVSGAGSLGEGGWAIHEGAGAGGGGYYGGGGGASGSPYGAGGGGSGYVTPSATNATTTNGGRTGDGLIRITFEPIPPTTTITSGPTGTTADRTPTFGFEADDSGANLECSISTGPEAFGPCFGPAGTHTPPIPLPDADYTFTVRATDQDGNQEPNPPTRSFSVRADREAETPEIPLVMRLRAPNPQQGFGAARGLIVCQGGDCAAELKGTVRIRRGSGRPSLVIPLRFERSTLALQQGERHEFVARLTPRARKAARRADANGRRVVARIRAEARFEDDWSVQSNMQRVRLRPAR